MPNLRLYLPHGLLNDQLVKKGFMDSAAGVVSVFLGDCTPDEVDVFLHFYKEEDVRLGALVLVEITAYPYATRMETITRRLTDIKRGLGEMVQRIPVLSMMMKQNPALSERELVSVSFIPIPEGCWV